MPAKDDKGRFLTGNNGGPGRPPGSKNKIAEDFLKALASDFEANGETVIQTVRATKPETYMKIVADLVPKDVNLGSDPERPLKVTFE